MRALPLFCPHCGVEYRDYLDTVVCCEIAGECEGIGVNRRCMGCWQWEFIKEGREMIEMITRDDPIDLSSEALLARRVREQDDEEED